LGSLDPSKVALTD